MKEFFSAKRLAVLGILTALSFLLYFIKMPLSFMFPSFLELNIADFPALIGGFALGPVSGCLIVLIRTLLKLPFTSTVCVGELADFFLGIAFVLPSSLIYASDKTKKTAVISLLVGIVSTIIVAVIVNRLINIPFYVKVFFNDSWAPLISMCKPLFPNITVDNFYNFYLWLSVVPFNLIRCLITALLTFLVYKRVSNLINKF